MYFKDAIISHKPVSRDREGLVGGKCVEGDYGRKGDEHSICDHHKRKYEVGLKRGTSHTGLDKVLLRLTESIFGIFSKKTRKIKWLRNFMTNCDGTLPII